MKIVAHEYVPPVCPGGGFEDGPVGLGIPGIGRNPAGRIDPISAIIALH